MAALGFRCCARAFSSCGERGLLFIAVRRLLTAVAFHCRAWTLDARSSIVVVHRLSSCDPWALEHRLNSFGARA